MATGKGPMGRREYIRLGYIQWPHGTEVRAGTYSGVTKSLKNDRSSPVLQKIMSVQPLHPPDLWETIDSIVILKGVVIEEKEDKRRPRAKVRWEGLKMFGWVDNV